MKNKAFLIIAMAVLSLGLTYLYQALVITYPEGMLKEYSANPVLNSKEIKLNFTLDKSSYLLKLKHPLVKESKDKTIFINGFKLNTNICNYVKKGGLSETNWLYIPREFVKEGRNELILTFSKNHPQEAEIILTNYRKKFRDAIFVFFSDSLYSGTVFPRPALFFPLVILVIGLAAYSLKRLLGLVLEDAFVYIFFSILPFLVVLIGLKYISFKLYSIKLSSFYFFWLGLLSSFVVLSGLIVFKVKEYYESYALNRPEPLKDEKASINYGRKIHESGKLALKKISRIKETEFVKSIHLIIVGTGKNIHWLLAMNFTDKPVVLSLAFFMLSAFFSLFNSNSFPGMLAETGYFCLVAGIALKFFKFIREAGQQ
ncbi:MAG: hypothetical protein PHN57_00795 [Candidatus Omnitrophica bacterium]|nr:hypothetical protein [Candidatus Omnitrophota bacterium]